ncbi:hypothetical protein C7475_10682 [Chitinophaga sp. S165]|nr:hypothetical protein C7475_10682 [Chitinophaga sp. S165]
MTRVKAFIMQKSSYSEIVRTLLIVALILLAASRLKR